MPITKSAKKKLRQDKKRTQQNLLVKKIVRTAILTFKRKPTPAALAKVTSALDMAAKKKVIHANKAARLKSRLSKLIGKKPHVTTVEAKTATRPVPDKKTKKKAGKTLKSD